MTGTCLKLIGQALGWTCWSQMSDAPFYRDMIILCKQVQIDWILWLFTANQIYWQTNLIFWTKSSPWVPFECCFESYILKANMRTEMVTFITISQMLIWIVLTTCKPNWNVANKPHCTDTLENSYSKNSSSQLNCLPSFSLPKKVERGICLSVWLLLMISPCLQLWLIEMMDKTMTKSIQLKSYILCIYACCGALVTATKSLLKNK